MTRKAGIFYYFPEFFKKFFPGALFLLVAGPALWRGRRIFRENPGMLFCLIWAVVYLFLIQLAAVRNHRYLLPAYPPIAVITARGMADFLEKHPGPGRRKGMALFACIGAGVVCVVAPVALWVWHGWSPGPLVLSLVSIGGLIFSWKVLKDSVVFICALCVVSLLFLDLGRTVVNPRVSDVGHLYRVLQERDIRAKDVLLLGTAPRVQKTLSFYFNHLVRQADHLSSGRLFKAIVVPAGGAAPLRRVYGPGLGTVRVKDPRNRGERDVWVVFFPRGLPPAES